MLTPDGTHWEVGVGRSEVQDYLHLHCEFKASLGYLGLCLNNSTFMRSKRKQALWLFSFSFLVKYLWFYICSDVDNHIVLVFCEKTPWTRYSWVSEVSPLSWQYKNRQGSGEGTGSCIFWSAYVRKRETLGLSSPPPMTHTPQIRPHLVI